MSDDRVEKIVDTIAESAATGEIGDGKIFLYAAQDAIRIRNRQRGEVAPPSHAADGGPHVDHGTAQRRGHHDSPGGTLGQTPCSDAISWTRTVRDSGHNELFAGDG